MLYFFYKQFIANLLSESEKEREIPEKEDKTEELCKSGMPNRPSGKGSHFYIDTKTKVVKLQNSSCKTKTLKFSNNIIQTAKSLQLIHSQGTQVSIDTSIKTETAKPKLWQVSDSDNVINPMSWFVIIKPHCIS